LLHTNLVCGFEHARQATLVASKLQIHLKQHQLQLCTCAHWLQQCTLFRCGHFWFQARSHAEPQGLKLREKVIVQ
jgi:hypothetical protein